MQRLYYLLVISAVSATITFPGEPQGDLENTTKIKIQ